MSDPAFWAGKTVVVTGGAGFIGTAVVRCLTTRCGVPLSAIRIPRSASEDLRQWANAERVMAGADVVLHLATVTGGSALSREEPARQYRDSTLIDLNVVEAARLAGVAKVVALGNLFAYAEDAVSPLDECTIFDGLPGDSHRGAGWMKRNLALLADLYARQYQFPLAVVFTANAYGPHDSLDRRLAHVIPATILKCLLDPELVVWGDGSPVRDFLYVDDIAAAMVLGAERLPPGAFANVGSGAGISVRELVTLIAEAAAFHGTVRFDTTKPKGDALRLASVTRGEALLGFRPEVGMREGMQRTVAWYRGELARR